MKVLRILNEKLEEVFLVILMIVAVIIVSAQIITRFVTKTPLPWSEEVARYIFLWLVWVGAAFATRERRHIRIDVLVNRLPKIGKKFCTVISTIIWLLFVIFMVYISFTLTRSVFLGGQIATGSGLPMWIPYASIPVGMTLMLFRILQNCYYDLKAMRGGSKE